MIRKITVLRYHPCPLQATSHLCQVASHKKGSLCFRLMGCSCISSLSHSAGHLAIPAVVAEELVCLLTEIMDIFPAVLVGGKGGERT